MENSEQLVSLGVVGKPFGIQGALKISLSNAESKTLRPGLVVKFAPVTQEGEVYLTVENVKSGGRIKFTELNCRNRAELFRGAQVYVKREDFPKIAPHELYLMDLIGFKALSLDGAILGEVLSFYDNGAQAVLEIKTLQGHIADVPYVKQIVPQVNLKEKTLTLDPPIGLIDGLY